MSWAGGQAPHANAAQAVPLTGAAAGDPQRNSCVDRGWRRVWSGGEVDGDENAGMGERLLIQAR